MNYTVGEMAEELGVAPSTLRYYDREGLLPFVQRTEGGARLFKDSDREWLQIIICLKKTGMKLQSIREFVEMAMRGDVTIQQRLDMVIKQRAAVGEQLRELTEVLRILEFKEWYYTLAKENGTTSVPRNMALDEIPERFREVRLKLKGE